MAHSIARTTPPIPPAGGGDAGALSREETTRIEWDILMTRDQRWVTCRAGITDPEELARELEWFQLGNPSGSVTYRVLERTITLRERLLDGPPATAPARRGGARSRAGAGANQAAGSGESSRARPLERRRGNTAVDVDSDRATRPTPRSRPRSQEMAEHQTNRLNPRPSCPSRRG